MGKSKREREQAEALKLERDQLREEVKNAERECAVAQMRFEDALGADQVDYAIYALEAAEKKLDMMLRKAKLFWHANPELSATEVRVDNRALGSEVV